jgi:hypothetical protein
MLQSKGILEGSSSKALTNECVRGLLSH